MGIREIRKAHGLSVAQLAERIAQQGVQVTADHVSNVELGYKRASDPLMTAWCAALNLHRLDVEQPAPVTVAEKIPAASR